MTSLQLSVSDLQKTTDFYRNFLGFELDEPHRHDGNESLHHDLAWGDFASGSFVMLHLVQAEPDNATQNAQVGFSVDDVDGLHERAQELQILVIDPPHEEEWGRNAKYADPDGNVVSLTEG